MIRNLYSENHYLVRDGLYFIFKRGTNLFKVDENVINIKQKPHNHTLSEGLNSPPYASWLQPT